MEWVSQESIVPQQLGFFAVTDFSLYRFGHLDIKIINWAEKGNMRINIAEAEHPLMMQEESV